MFPRSTKTCSMEHVIWIALITVTHIINKNIFSYKNNYIKNSHTFVFSFTYSVVLGSENSTKHDPPGKNDFNNL